MNKIYRIIWSKTRHAFVVTHERAKAQGKPSSNCGGVKKFGASALMLIGSGPAFATICSSTVTPSSTTVVSSNINNGDCAGIRWTGTAGGDITVNSGISVIGAAGAITKGAGGLALTDGPLSLGSLVNNGTLSGVGGGVSIWNDSGSNLSSIASIANSGLISSSNGSGVLLVNSLSKITGVLDNNASGTISGSVDGIRVQSGAISTLNNQGSIIGNTNGISLYSGSSVGNSSGSSSGSDLIDILLNGGFVNSGSISGQNGNGIYLSSSSISGGIVNNGAITGRNRGIYLSDVSVISGGINNRGTIAGTFDTGIHLSNSSSVNGGIVNSGTISGRDAGINSNNSSSLAGGITNSGLIRSTGSFSQAISISNYANVDSIINQSNGRIDGPEGIAITNHGALGRLDNQAGGTIMGSGSYGAVNIGRLFSYFSSSARLLSGSSARITGGVTNSGIIQGSYGLYLDQGIILNGVTNSGALSGTNVAGIYLNSSSLSGGISNSGTISGRNAGIQLNDSSIAGDMVNSGLIEATSTSNNRYAILLNNNSTIGSIINQSGGRIDGPEGISVRGGSIIDSVVNQDGASITASGTYGALNIGNPSSSGSTGTISNGVTNAGTIAGQYGIFMRSGAIANGLTNSGLISGTGNDAIYLTQSTISGGINNSGTISSGDPNVSYLSTDFDGIFLNQSTLSGGINNSGTISGINRGIRLTDSTISGGVTNSGSISGGDATGIYLNNAAITGNIVNSGRIGGFSAGIGINQSTITGGITNSGTLFGDMSLNNSTISGDISNSGVLFSDGTGLHISSSTIAGNITNSSSISGINNGISIEGSGSNVAGLISNSGTISAISGPGLNMNGASVGGGLINSGRISGQNTGLALGNGSNLTGGVTNSGTISGGVYSIQSSGGSTLANINISGGSARFIGDVAAANTDVSVKSGAVFDNDNAFNVKSFTVEDGAYFNLGAGPTSAAQTSGINVSNGFSNAGTLAVASNATGVINGDFTNTGTFLTAVSGMTQYGKLAVSGSTTLGNTLNVYLTSGSDYSSLQIGGTLSGVITGSTVNGQFATVENNHRLLFSFLPVYSADRMDLTIARGSTVLETVDLNHNPSAGGAAREFDNILNGNGGYGSDMANVINRLGNLETSKQVSDAVSQTVPLLGGGQSQATRNALRGVNRIIQSRQEGQHGRSSGDEFFGNQQVWFKPFGSWANQDNRNNVSGYDASTYGFVFGSDVELNAVNRLGAAFSYSRSNVNSNSSIARQDADVDSFRFITYGSHSLSQATDLNFQADFGYHNTDGKRNITTLCAGSCTGVAKSSYDSYSGHVGLGLGHTLALSDATSFTPSIRADYTVLRDSAYSETGAGALNLNVKSNTTHELILGVDGKLTQALTDMFALTANIGGGYDALNESARITSAFAGVPAAAFSTNGLNPSPWLGRGGFGVIAKATKTLEISGRYDAEVRDSYDNQTASLKVRWSY